MLGARERAEQILRECPEWFHSIELAPGIFTPGRLPPENLASTLAALQLPDLHSKTVIDIGAYDGYFSFAAERQGASRVIALDHYAWSADMAEYMKEWRASWKTGIVPPAPSETRHWRPAELPGRRPFDAAREILGSRVEPVVGDFMSMDLSTLGQFDVVLFLGVLYHLEDPLRAMRRVAAITAPGGLAVIQTAAMEIPGIDWPCCEFFPGAELNNDASNWWAPNSKALVGLCHAAGFREVAIINSIGLPTQPWRPFGTRMRAAFKHLIAESHIQKRLGLRQQQTPTPDDIRPVRYSAIAHARF